MGSQRVILDALGGFIDREPDLTVLAPPRGGGLPVPTPESPRPDVALFDLDERGSIDATFERLSATASASRTIALAASPTPVLCFRAFRAGAVGLLSKCDSPELLLRAIRKVHAGELWFGRTATAGLLDLTRANGRRRAAPQDGQPLLSARERRLITLVGQGRRNAEIARHLLTSEATVRAGLTAIFRKLGMPSRFDLMIYAARHGFVGPQAAFEGMCVTPSRKSLSLATGAAGPPHAARPATPDRGTETDS